MKYVAQYCVFSLITAIASLHGNIPITHGCSCVSVKWFRTAFLLLVFFSQYYEGICPRSHLYVWWALPDPVTNVHAGLEPQQAIQLFPPEPRPESLMVPQAFQRNRFPSLTAGVREQVPEQKRLWLPLRPAVSTPQSIGVFALWACVIFHTITSQCAFAAMSLQITLHSRSHLNLSKRKNSSRNTFFPSNFCRKIVSFRIF